MLYPIAIIQQEEQYYGRLPDLPNLEVTGTNIADIISNARRDVIQYLQDIHDSESPIPKGSDVASHITNSEYAGWIWAIVNIDAARIVGEAVEYNLTIPDRLFKRLNNHVIEQNTDITSYLIDLINKNLQS